MQKGDCKGTRLGTSLQFPHWKSTLEVTLSSFFNWKCRLECTLTGFIHWKDPLRALYHVLSIIRVSRRSILASSFPVMEAPGGGEAHQCQDHGSNKEDPHAPCFNVAYKYNLLLVLKILSYTLYNNLTDEMQAVCEETSWVPENRQATFSLYTIIIMKLKRTTRGMRKLAHWECNDCFREMQSLHRRLYERERKKKKNWDNCHYKMKEKIKIRNQPKNTWTVTSAAASKECCVYNYRFFFFFFQCTESVSAEHWWLLLLMYKHRSLS